MKATGITRKIDELGRVVIPIEVRRSLDMQEGDHLEIYTNRDSVVLKKHYKTCIFCPETDQSKMVTYKGKLVCQNCIKEMR